MKVLLVEHDLYDSVGGGQTVYRRLIETNPGIEFYYLGGKERASAARPPNARMLPYKQVYEPRHLTGEFSDLGVPLWAYADFLEAANIAASVAQVQFDVADLPDYRVFGYLLGPALRRHGQKNCRLVLALHGNLSETQRVNWGPCEWIDISADQREQWQYRTVDLRYGLSRDYLEHYEAIAGIAGHYLNPLRFVEPPKPVKWDRADRSLSLNFIGRTEGFKGPDLFVELLAWLPTGAFDTARIIGPSIVDRNGMNSKDHLLRMASRRALKVQYHPCMTKAEMLQLYSGRAITVLPSRMDTFNLTALESLFAGCPVAVSSKAGVCRFLRDSLPGVPFTSLDVDQLYANVPALLDLTGDYDRHRERLLGALAQAKPKVDGSTLREIYASEGQTETYLRAQAERWYDRLERFHARHRAPKFERLAGAGVKICDALRPAAVTPRVQYPVQEEDLWSHYRQLFYMRETTAAEIDAKVVYGAELSTTCRVDRARLWAELARLERMRGNDFVAATYDVRVMRAVGGDRLGMLPWVVETLKANGYAREAEAVVALYGPEEQRFERAGRLLAEACVGHREVPDRPFELLEDHRGAEQPRVSVIVSLYRAANKLETFLRMLAQQPWVASGQVELVFVDSHSPTEELEIFRKIAGRLGIKAVYARTAARETIQTAWNRGIKLARAPYLSFLGVDEMVRPDCFATLAGELDADPALDWVQGNSVITEVDSHGTLVRDVMLYQRIPYEQDLVYLETCYLSWVGSLYRRNMHERFGYYDESFGAAGDTEFKNRVLPFIKSKTLPQTLGVFLNYPEERTTQSPRAEIEDLRAWYLHRSEAGVAYALERRNPGDAWALFKKAVAYRKSYLAHASSDLEFADAIARFAARRGASPIPEASATAVRRALDAYRDLDWMPHLAPRAAVREKGRVEAVAAGAAKEFFAVPDAPVVNWSVFNDNRYEQHSQPWQGRPLAGTHSGGQRFLWNQTASCVTDSLTPDEAEATAPDLLAAMQGLSRQAETLLAAVSQLVLQLRTQGKAEQARDVEMVAKYFHELVVGRSSFRAEGTGAGAMLCRVLAESEHGAPVGNLARYDRKFTDLCEVLAAEAANACPPLADGLGALASDIARQLEENRALEVAARLLSCPSPTEAVRRHGAELNLKVLETIQRAADSARLGGKADYSARLNAMAAAIRSELEAAEKRRTVGRAACPTGLRSATAPTIHTLSDRAAPSGEPPESKEPERLRDGCTPEPA